MTRTKMRGLKASIASVIVLMLLLGVVPGQIIRQNTVEAYGEKGNYFYAETYLYNYDYDAQSFEYKNQFNTQTSYGTPLNYDQQQCRGLREGDRWMTGLQVPYETLNRRISEYYADKGTDIPALYFGNFFGTCDDSDNTNGRGTGLAQDPYQYTYITGDDVNHWYSDAYNNFWLSANNAPKYDGGHVAVQGLVNNKLTNGTLTQGANKVELPQFSDSFIDSTSYAHKYSTGDGFPFNITTENGIKYYGFNSATDNKRYYKNGSILVGSETSDPKGTVNWRSDGANVLSGAYGFFPFNETNITNTIKDRRAVDYGFGMKVIIPFSLTRDGMLIGDDGSKVDTVFHFSGDDDVWVFVDDVLVLDLGGDHAYVNGSINFNRAKQSNGNTVTIGQVTNFDDGTWGTNRRRRALSKGALQGAVSADTFNSSLNSIFTNVNGSFDADDFYDPKTQHTLTVFYMERGMFESNLSIDFNFAPVNPHQLTVEEQTKYDRVATALQRQTATVADSHVFNYTIQNQGTKASEVADSGIVFPNYENINRVNTDAHTSPTTVLATSSNVQQRTIVNSDTRNYVYLDYSNQSWWANANAATWCYFWGDNNQKQWVKATSIGNNKVRCEIPDGMKNVIFVRKASNLGGGFDDAWNQTVDLHVSSTSYYFTVGNEVDGKNTCSSGTNSNYQYSVTTTTSTQEPYTFGSLFTGGKNMTPLNSVAYNLTDPYAASALTGITDTAGHFNLFYGETANFRSQFGENSTMSVVQAAKLYSSNNTLGTTITSDTVPGAYHNHTFTETAKTLSDYYSTSVTAVDVNDNNTRIEEYRNTQPSGINYQFNNNDATSRNPIHLHQTFVNEVKVGHLVIEKKLAFPGESNEQFTFTVTLTNLFNGGGGTVTLGNLPYEVFSKDAADYYATNPKRSGTVADGVRIAGGEVAVIKGIPVYTNYSVTETATPTNYRAKTASTVNGTIVEDTYSYIDDSITGNDSNNNTKQVINERKTGTLTVTKTITGTGADLNKTFPVTVALTAPQGVTLGNYIKDAATNVESQTKITGLTISATSFSFNVTNGSSITFKNIPYGTTYTVTETDDNAYTAAYTYSDSVKIINDDTATTAGTRTGPADTVEITNTRIPPATTSIEIIKVSSSTGHPRITGAQFALYDTEAHARAKGSAGKITPTVNGAVYTFTGLQTNTTYYLVELAPPPGYTIKTEMTPVTTNTDDTVKTLTIENDLIPIVMPETGGVPFTVNLTFLGILAMSLAGAAMLIYKRKLQKTAVKSDEQGRRED